jgi:hypothetical protein
MYVSVSRVTGPWRAAFPENSHHFHAARDLFTAKFSPDP